MGIAYREAPDSPATLLTVATRKTSLTLFAATLGWAVFGSWALWADAVLGHAVAFFFFSLCFLGLAVQLAGAKRGLASAVVLLIGVAGASEYLQPRFTSRPAEWADVVSDVIGVGVASVVVAIAAVAFRERSALWAVLGSLCLVALAGSLGLAASGSQRIEERFDQQFGCWRKGIEAVDGGPLIQIEGTSVRIGDESPQALGDGLIAADSTDLRCSVLESGGYSIVATVVPASIETGGPMRIFTSSEGTQATQVNTHLGQEFAGMSVRIGFRDELQWETVPDVFVSGERVTVAMTVTAEQVEVFVNGELRATFDLAGELFAGWDGDFPILIGDEFTGNRTYEGEIESVSFFDRALVAGDLALTSEG